MNTETLKDFGILTLKNTGGIMGIGMTGLPTKIKSMLPNSKIGGYLGSGFTYGTAIDAVNLVFEKKSKILSGDYIGALDDIGFFSGWTGVIDMTNLDATTYDIFSKVSPLSQDINIKLVEGALVSAGLATANILDQSTGTNIIFDFIRKPVSTTIKYVNGQ